MLWKSLVNRHIEPRYIFEDKSACVVDNILPTGLVRDAWRDLQSAPLIRSQGLYSTDGWVPEEQYGTAEADDRMFSYSVVDEGGGDLGKAFRIALDAFSSETAAAYVRETLGVDVQATRWQARSGHLMVQGDLLASHTDADYRHAAAVLYVSPGWQPGFGGELVLGGQGRESRSIEPRQNRLVLFNTYQMLHWAKPITAPPDEWRRGCLSGWYQRADNV